MVKYLMVSVLCVIFYNGQVVIFFFDDGVDLVMVEVNGEQYQVLLIQVEFVSDGLLDWKFYCWQFGNMKVVFMKVNYSSF